MARSKQKKNKDKASNAKGTYGSNLSTPNTRSKSKEKEKRKSSSKADAKSKAAKKPKSKDKPKSKSKHPKHQFSKDSIKQRLTAASSKPIKKANPFKRPPTERPRKRKKPQRIEFQMNIPDSNHDYFLKPENVPWYNAQNQERFRENYSTNHVVSSAGFLTTTGTSRPSSEDGLQLPSETVLAHLDTEIQSFSAYVRLTPSERRARDAFLSHITEILTTQFANGGNTRGGYRKKSDSDDIYVEPFGSYATPQVCTFASDVDMCLWGLVKEEERPNSHLKFVSSDSNEGDDEGDAVLNTNRGGECPLLTESSLLRTMDAIQSAQAASRQPAAEKLKSESEIAAASDDCLFVIDRVGVNVDNLEEEEKMPTEDIANAKVQSTDEETLQKEPDSEQTSNKKQSVKDQPKSKSKNKNLPKEQFEFVIDVDGVHELGGDVEDLPDFAEKVQGASDEIETTTDKFSQGNKNEEKVEEPTLDMTAAEERVVSGKAKQNNLDGKSHDKVINLDDDSSEDEVIVVDDDSVDEADKLDSFYSRQSSNRVSENAKIHSPPREAAARSNCGENDVISVGDSSDESDDDNIANYRRDEVLELSVTSNSIASKPIVKPVFGPTGKTRVRVVSVLQGLTSHLRRSSFTNTVECRSRARVPIINCNTRTGFEGDIAIGGHNGVDTSTYAQRQADRFQSFASIVLVLKVLMVQQGLDKPFTGGLGSYKLYVLVAHHIEHHLANGGNDRPSEILISLLFRYSCIGSINDKATTDLESIRNAEGLIASDDGVCDLSPVFRIPDLVEMFRECHERLFDRMLLAEGFDDKVCNNLSYLSSMIDCFRLKEARESSDRRSKISDEITRPIGRDHPGKVSASRKIGKVFSKSEYGSGALKRQIPTSFLDNGSNKRRQSYNDSQPKRGPRGGLIPLHRPDVAAMKSIRSNPEKELFLRGTKNRKNKKKQNRDDALRIFSRRSI